MDSECPFHDLDPSETVYVRLDQIVWPLSAERACHDWHTAEYLRLNLENPYRVITKAIDKMMEATDD